MFVAVSSASFPDLSMAEMLDVLLDLQFSHFELDVHEQQGHLKPSSVLANLDNAIDECRATRRLTICALNLGITAEGEAYYEQFAACCKLAKAVKVVTMVVPSAELGTPFNAEVERLQRLVAIASMEGAVVALKTETGCMTESPDTAKSFCDHVKGLGLTLDPSHYIYGPLQGGSYDHILPYVCHVHLRDTTKNRLQVRVGQGEVEYGRLITQLQKLRYTRALCIDMMPMEGVEHPPEVRKMRLLLESLLM